MTDFTDGVDLASVRLGGAVLLANDEFFAEKENLLKPADAVFLPHEYTDRGKWMDGWESRRKREAGFDWCIVRLGVPGVIRGVVVDTSFFRGNYPAQCSLEACAAPTDAALSELVSPETVWTEVLSKSDLQGDSKNMFAILDPCAYTHVRLNIFPDGGVARLRVFGDVIPDWRRIGHARGEVDVAAIEHGGQVLTCSDMFFGERRNLIMPGRAVNMSDGWETRRRRGPGHDWALIRLGATASITRVEIDTNHFKGNFPDTCDIEVCDASGASTEALTAADNTSWRPLLPRTKLHAHTRHRFEAQLVNSGAVTHLRINVYPDGGVSRLRVYGTLDRDARLALGLARLNTLPASMTLAELRACCHSTAWARAMLGGRPYGSVGDVLARSDAAWRATSAKDWHEAFAGHPRIGERNAAAGQSATARAWASGEQAGTDGAGASVRAEIAEANRAYEAKFGFIYIVCATGKTADEMLATARARMSHTVEEELAVAAAEQHKITRIRLEKLLEP